MIYWLCLICCIQSSYFASPLVRTKHEMYKLQTNKILPGRSKEFGSFDSYKSDKTVRSLDEKFPGLKYNIKERDSIQNNSNRFLTRNQNPNPKINPRRGYRNSSQVSKSAVPQIKFYDPNEDSKIIYNQIEEKQDTTQRDQNKNQDPRTIKSNRDSMRKPKSHEEPTQFDYIYRENSNEDNNDESMFGGRRQNEKSKENASNRVGNKRNHHHKKLHKKTHNKSHHFGHSNPFNPIDVPLSGREGNEESDSNFGPKPDSPNHNENDELANYVALLEDHVPFKLNLPNLSKTEEVFAQNDIIEDQQPKDYSFGQREESANLPFQTKELNSPEEVGEHQNEANVPFKDDVLSSDLKSGTANFMNNDVLQEEQQYIGLTEPQYESPKAINSVNAQIETFPTSYLKRNDQTESTTVKNFKELTEMYKPIHFKLDDGSQSLSNPDSSLVNIQDQSPSQLLERRDASMEASSTKASDAGHSVNPSNFKTDELVLSHQLGESDGISSFSTTQQDHILRETSQRKFKKKSNNFNGFINYPIKPIRDHKHKNFRKSENSFYRKRSDKNNQMVSSNFSPRSPNVIRLYRKPASDSFEKSISENEFEVNKGQSKNERGINSSDNYERDPYPISTEEIITTSKEQRYDFSNTQSQNDSSFNWMRQFANSSSASDEEIMTTPLISEYPKPTLGIKDKIMKKLSDNQKRSYQRAHFFDSHNDSMQLRNKKYLPQQELNPFDDKETQIHSREAKQLEDQNAIAETSISNAEMNNDMQSPNQEMADRNEILSDNPNNSIAISKRNDLTDDRISRVYQGSKTTQRIVKDPKSSKETNVIEDQKENIVDDIHLIKEEKAKLPLGGDDARYTNKDSAPNLLSDNDDSYPDYYENGEIAENETYIESKVPISFKKNNQGPTSLPIDKEDNSKFGDKNNVESQKSGLNDQMFPPITRAINGGGMFIAKKAGNNSNNSYNKSSVSDKSKADLVLQNSLNEPTEDYADDYDLTDKNGIMQSSVGVVSTTSASQYFSGFNDYESPYPKQNRLEDKNELGSQTVKLEPSVDYESLDQEPNDEPKTGEQPSLMQSQKSKGILEQSTEDFIDLEEQEIKKDGVLEDLEKFPTGKRNNKPNAARIPTKMVPIPREKMERQRTFLEFSTILPNEEDVGEFQREEKVERQSKVMLKNKGIIRNGTASIFGEKKIEVKNNKQNYHETFMEEKGESKYPNEEVGYGTQKKGNVTETPIKTRQALPIEFPRQENIINYPMNSDGKIKSWNGNYEDESPQSEKIRKDADYTNDDEYKNDNYYYAEEENPDSTVEVPHAAYDDYLEYVEEPKDVWQNEDNIDDISKRSETMMDANKLMRNAKYMRSFELSTEPPGEIRGSSEPSIEPRVMDDNISNKEPSPGRLFSKDVEEIQTSDGTLQDTIDSSTLASTKELLTEPTLERNIKWRKSSAQMGRSKFPKHNLWNSLDYTMLPGKAMKTRKEDSGGNSTRTASSGSGNIVYVTVRTTTDKESQYNDFLQIQEGRRRDRQPKRHLDSVYRRQKKHTLERKTKRHLRNPHIK